jgi:hypothetical protein
MERSFKLGATPERLTSKYNCKTSTFAKKKTYKLTCPCCNFTLPSQENHQVVQVVQNAIKNIMITLN